MKRLGEREIIGSITDPLERLTRAFLALTAVASTAPDQQRKEADAALLEQLQAGDLDALGRLIDQHGGAVFAFLVRRVVPRETAEDLFQETWIRVAERCGTFKRGCAARPWLYRIAMNVLTDHARRNAALRRGGETQHIPLHESDADSRPGPLDASAMAIRNEERGSLRAAVEALPEIYRDVIRLRYFEELSTDEVAQTLECAEGTVKSRLARGLAMLQQNLEAPR